MESVERELQEIKAAILSIGNTVTEIASNLERHGIGAHKKANIVEIKDWAKKQAERHVNKTSRKR